jgi:hypothetical protein
MTETCLHDHNDLVVAGQHNQQHAKEACAGGGGKKRRLSTETYAADPEFAAFLIGSGDITSVCVCSRA